MGIGAVSAYLSRETLSANDVGTWLQALLALS